MRFTRCYSAFPRRPVTGKHFIFDLTCDVIGDPKVNEIGFPSTNLTGLSNAVWILGIRPVVSELRGGFKKSPPPHPTRSRYKQTPPGRGLKSSCRKNQISSFKNRGYRAQNLPGGGIHPPPHVRARVNPRPHKFRLIVNNSDNALLKDFNFV